LYSWRRNGSLLRGQSSATLSFASVTESMAGTYTVTVANLYGAVSSAPATLVVQAPPVISAQPQSFSVTEGAPITLSVTAGGAAPLAYEWQKNEVAITGANSSSLSFSSPKASDSGTYKVTISNEFGSVLSSEAIVLVSPIAISSIQRQGETILITFNTTAGQDYTLEKNTSLQAAGWETAQVIAASGTTSVASESLSSGTIFYRIRK
jgi:hypothetical protein